MALTPAQQRALDNNLKYWRDREEEAQRHYIAEDDALEAKIGSKYNYLYMELDERINAFYSRYASAEGIDMATAQQKVSQMDVKAFEERAKQYVEAAARMRKAEEEGHYALAEQLKRYVFSDEANEALRLYNATMRINRLEMLKAQMGLDITETFNDIQQLLGDGLDERVIEELERQSGILGETVSPTAKRVNAIVNASFNNATWSQRLWGYQDQLRDELSKLLTNGIIQGRNPIELARELRKTIGGTKANTERLTRTEMSRVQTAAQEESYKESGYEQYIFIAVGTACPICKELDEQVFPVENLKDNQYAPPIHPNCRCSTAAYMDREALERELFGEEYNSLGGEASRNTGEDVEYNSEASFSIKLDGYSEEVQEGLAKAMRDVAEKGGKDGNEHLRLVDLDTGDWFYYETNGLPDGVGYDFWSYLKDNPEHRFAFVHNHNTDSAFSETDMRTLLTTEQIPVMIAVRNDGVIYVAERKGNPLSSGWFDDLYEDEINELNKQVADGNISIARRTIERELLIVDNLIKDYTKAGELVEYDTRG